MEIKRKVEFVVATRRRFVVRRSAHDKEIICQECREPMLAIEQVAKALGIKQRRIFQLIETGSVHFAEPESGGALICITSLAEVLDGREQKTAVPVADNETGSGDCP